MVVVVVERKQQKRCPSGGGKSNVEMLVLKRNDINVLLGGGGGGGQAEHNKSEREIKEKWDDGATQIFPRLKPIALRWKVIDLSWDLSLEAILLSS